MRGRGAGKADKGGEAMAEGMDRAPAPVEFRGWLAQVIREEHGPNVMHKALALMWAGPFVARSAGQTGSGPPEDESD